MGVEELSTEPAEPVPAGVTYSVRGYWGHSLTENHRNLILSKWIRSLRHGNDFFRLMDYRPYHAAYQHYIVTTLSKPRAVVRFALLTDEPDVILGFSVTRENILDYIHVHKDCRKIGIGRSLVPDSIDTITHVTRTGLTIWGSKAKHWKFNPFI